MANDGMYWRPLPNNHLVCVSFEAACRSCIQHLLEQAGPHGFRHVGRHFLNLSGHTFQGRGDLGTRGVEGGCAGRHGALHLKVALR